MADKQTEGAPAEGQAEPGTPGPAGKDAWDATSADAVKVDMPAHTPAHTPAKLRTSMSMSAKKRVTDLVTTDAMDKRHKFMATLDVVLGLYALVQTSFLTVFVPQECPGNPTGKFASPWFKHSEENEPHPHTCTFFEKLDWYALTRFNNFCLCWNLFTCALLLSAHCVFWVREQFVISHFDHSIDFPEVHWMHAERKEWPGVAAKLDKWNWRAATIGKWAGIFYILNVILSSVMIFDFYYGGFRTVTGLGTIVALFAIKFHGQVRTVRMAMTNGSAVSLFIHAFHDNNILEQDYKDSHTPDGTRLEVVADEAGEEAGGKPAPRTVAESMLEVANKVPATQVSV